MGDCSSSPPPPAADMVAGEAPTHPSFQCCVCLDLLYKPIVLACGHISCFWCVQKAMHGLRASHCPICRQPYNHFPSICQLLHFLLLKIEPVAYKRREKEILEEEVHHDCFSPQLMGSSVFERVHPKQNNSYTSNESDKSSGSLKMNGCTPLEESFMQKEGLENRICKQLSVDDVFCAACKELLYQPTVLNCGHVYCESCLSALANGPLKCQVCQSVHPGDFPNVCLDLDHFLEEHFPTEYAMRKERVQCKILKQQHENPSSSASPIEKQNGESSCKTKEGHLWFDEDLSTAHVGVGCDSCGMYPIIGKRYKCKDCKERIGFDLCEACYNTSSKLPGRFNQQHTPDHKFELDESQMLCNILMLRTSHLEDLQPGIMTDDDFEEHENHDEAPDVGENQE